MSLYLLAVAAGLALLVWGADQVVVAASVTARALGVAPMLIGLAVVGFATSAPEVLVAATAAASGTTGLAIGNALGSNIANIGLVIGCAALLRPLSVRSPALRQELPVMLAVSVLPVLLFPDQRLGRGDGIALAAGLVAFLYWIVRLGLRTRGRDPIEAQYAAEIPTGIGPLRTALAGTLGLAALLAGANALVWGAGKAAGALGISDVVIGLTVVAIGTSLPELAVSVVSARKGEHGLAVGNVIGSNAFNLLAVIGVAAVIHPADLAPEVVRVHLPVMVAFTLVFFVIAYNRPEEIRIGRVSGAALLAAFCVYQAWVVGGVA